MMESDKAAGGVAVHVEAKVGPDQIAGIVDFLRDVRDFGLRYDMTPTHDMRDQASSETFWHWYFREADQSIRDRAREALTLLTPNDAFKRGAPEGAASRGTEG